jgi:hypothetical protein
MSDELENEGDGQVVPSESEPVRQDCTVEVEGVAAGGKAGEFA